MRYFDGAIDLPKTNADKSEIAMADKEQQVLQPEPETVETHLLARRDFLLGLGKWSKAVIGGVILSGMLLPDQASSQPLPGGPIPDGPGGPPPRPGRPPVPFLDPPPPRPRRWYNGRPGWYNGRRRGWYNGRRRRWYNGRRRRWYNGPRY